MASKRIGYVDNYLDNFHSRCYLELAHGPLRERGYAVAGCTAMDPAEGRAWADKYGVPYYDSVAAMDPHVDVWVILSPNNPEHHLAMCQQVFPTGKPTYVDKVFAPDLKTAKAIFALADKHHVAMQTTSALRYTNVQAAVTEMGGRGALRHMVTWGNGRSFHEYAIHPVELAVSCLGPEAETLHRRGAGDQSQLIINFSGGRTLVVNVYCNASGGFAASLSTAETTKRLEVDGARIFHDTLVAIMDMWDTGKATVPRAESLAVRAILDAAANPAALTGFVQIPT